MNLIDLNDITIEIIKTLFYYAKLYKNINYHIPTTKYILGNAFFEPSTRTSLSFECAMKKLNGDVINFNKAHSSIIKGESDYDTIKTLEMYSDLLVIRHPDANFIHSLKDKVNIPIINGGNGAGEHPTQALLDLFTIHEHFDIFNTKRRIKILFVGDIKHSRTIHSLYYLLHMFDFFDIYFFCYPYCQNEYVNEENTVNDFSNIDKFDVVYCTRLQKERSDNIDIDIKRYILTKNIVSNMKYESIILHPLPRNEEIHTNVDNNKRACYFEQMKNGVYVRMAVIYYLLNLNEL
jgi:aspartate carbamoyltransferase catalytic subunit|tara:strand:- start:379 stop:1254 length:876 start_codon:yes stop_codon:yes gene_type:complete